MMWQALPEQYDLPSSERADVVAHEKRAFAPGENRQLHFDVVMPVVTGTRDALGMAGVEHGFDFAEVVRPAE